MNRFELAAKKIQDKYSISVEYVPGALCYPYHVMQIGCTCIRDAKKLAAEIHAKQKGYPHE